VQFKGAERENHITIGQRATAEEDKPAGGWACAGALSKNAGAAAGATISGVSPNFIVRLAQKPHLFG
jgi:hypothetical protein